MKTALRLLSLLTLLSLVLTACASPTPQATLPPVRETVVITQIVAGTPEIKIITTTPAPTQPVPTAAPATGTIVIRAGTGDGGDYYARLLTQLAAKAAPDIMQVGDDAVPSFVDKGAFVALDGFIQSEKFDPTIYLPGLLDPGNVAGKQYLLPKDYSPVAVYYNKKLFDAAGMAYPKEGWTWDDLLATAQKLTKTAAAGKVTQWGIQLPATWTTGFEYWVAAAGGTLISQDGKSFTGFMDSPEVIRAVQFYADLYNKHKVAPPAADLNQFGGGNADFANGKAAMMIFGRWPQSGFLKNPNISLGVVAPPKDKARANVLFWGGFGISSTSKDPKTTFTFLSYYVGEPGAKVWQDWALPAVKSVAESSGLTQDPIEGVWIGELNHLVARAYTFTPYWNETADPALRKVLETVILDPKADVKAVLTQAAKDAQVALDKLNKK